MGMRIRLQDENGEKIEEVLDQQGIIAIHLPPLSDQSYHCVRFIDPYGDTYFNRVQMETFLLEWGRVFDKVQEKEAKRLFVEIKTLAHRCQEEVHTYLKFLGD